MTKMISATVSVWVKRIVPVPLPDRVVLVADLRWSARPDLANRIDRESELLLRPISRTIQLIWSKTRGSRLGESVKMAQRRTVSRRRIRYTISGDIDITTGRRRHKKTDDRKPEQQWSRRWRMMKRGVKSRSNTRWRTRRGRKKRKKKERQS